MEIRNEHYHENIDRRCESIFPEKLQGIITELAAFAKFHMSSDLDAKETEKIVAAVVDLLKNYKYRCLPLWMVGEAFMKGSLGELGGTTRFTVRNVCIWMGAMYDKNMRIIEIGKSREDEKRRRDEEKAFLDIRRSSNIYARAMRMKMEWNVESKRERRGRMMAPADWDKVPIEKIVEKLKEGFREEDLTPQYLMS